MAHWKNQSIPPLLRICNEMFDEFMGMGKQIDFIYLQMDVCRDKILLYKKAGDAFKIFFWEDLYTQCENVLDKIKSDRDIKESLWREKHNELCKMINDEVSDTLDYLNGRGKYKKDYQKQVA